MSDKTKLIGHLGSGEEVWDRDLKPFTRNSDGKDNFLLHLSEALAKINSEGRKLIEHEARFDKVVGWTSIVPTSPEDKNKIIWYKMPGRAGYTRMVFRHTHEPTRLMTLFLNRLSSTAYVLSSFWYGPWTPPEPWEPGAGPEALAFWLTHAILYASRGEATTPWEITDRVPPEWQKQMDRYGNTEVVKEALQNKQVPDPELERLRIMAKAGWEIAIKLGQTKPDGAVH